MIKRRKINIGSKLKLQTEPIQNLSMSIFRPLSSHRLFEKKILTFKIRLNSQGRSSKNENKVMFGCQYAENFIKHKFNCDICCELSDALTFLTRDLDFKSWEKLARGLPGLEVSPPPRPSKRWRFPASRYQPCGQIWASWPVRTFRGALPRPWPFPCFLWPGFEKILTPAFPLKQIWYYRIKGKFRGAKTW